MVRMCPCCKQEIKHNQKCEAVTPFNHFGDNTNPVKHIYLKSLIKQFNELSSSHCSPYKVVTYFYPECSLIIEDDEYPIGHNIKFPNIDYMTDFVKGLLVHMQETIDRL